mgnify:FL=1|tara:strand:- start:104 stop:901 length:798 start_codon:yes stop_codon:yes gene_type:complete
MSETLTTVEQEPTEGVVLNEAEQDALQTAEKLEEERNPKLAGKFNNPQELEKAYKELESKLGKRDQPEEPEASEEVEEEPEQEPDTSDNDEEVDLSFLDTIYNEATSDELTDETVNKLLEMDVADLADMYVAYRQDVESKTASQDFTSDQVNALYNMVGGKEQYSNLINWAQDNISDDEQQMFDAVMDKGDAVAAFWAVRSLAYQYADKAGYEGERLSGRAPRNNQQKFRSQAELVQAMSDPRYEKDEAYRQDVATKLENSDINF